MPVNFRPLCPGGSLRLEPVAEDRVAQPTICTDIAGAGTAGSATQIGGRAFTYRRTDCGAVHRRLHAGQAAAVADVGFQSGCDAELIADLGIEAAQVQVIVGDPSNACRGIAEKIALVVREVTSLAKAPL